MTIANLFGAWPPGLTQALLALTIAVGLPILFVFVRHEIRLQRIRLLDQFDHIFPPRSDGPDHTERRRRQRTPSFEYVREKYLEDLPYKVDLIRQSDPDEYDRTLRVIDRLRWWRLKSSWVLLASSIPYVAFCAGGLFLLMMSGRPDCFGALLKGPCAPIILMGGLFPQTPPEGAAYVENVLTVAAFAFLGAYLFTLGVLTRAVSTFDLSPMTLLRVMVHILTAVGGAVVTYRAFPDLIEFAGVVGVKVGGAHSADLPRLWLASAFIFGLVPDLVINYLMGKAQNFTGAKITNTELFKSLKSTPLDIIDGIDFFTRFRLQQANIFEVQSLAVANPIMLFVETPYGLYQCMDWVAQAQLCVVVGPERFLAMRQYGLRTVFDLERAVLSRHSTTQMRRFVVALMVMSPSVAPDHGTAKFWTLRRGGGSKDDATAGVTAEGFSQYVSQLFAEPAAYAPGEPLRDADQTLKHFARMAVDDLHVHRLRQIWKLISDTLGADYSGLPDTEPPWS